jgi:excisionase family DNA binding protein
MTTNWKDQIEDITRDDDPDQLLTKHEVASLLRVSAVTVTRMGRDGRLPRVKLNDRMVRFRSSDVRRYIRERSQL